MNNESEMRKQLYISLGLSQKEASIYELLLEKGELAAREIEITTGMKKNTYVLLRMLVKKRLVIRIERGRKIYYQPAPPSNLAILAKEQVLAAQRQANVLAEILPKMTAQYSESVDRPVVRYVEGVEGLRDIYKMVYSQEIPESFGCLDLEIEERAVPELMSGELIPSRVEKKSRAWAVLADNDRGRAVAERDSQEMRESILLDPKKYPLPAEISVYGEKVVLLSFRKGKMTGLLVENKEMATSLASVYRALFEMRKLLAARQ